MSGHVLPRLVIPSPCDQLKSVIFVSVGCLLPASSALPHTSTISEILSLILRYNFRRRAEYGLMEDPQAPISDASLRSLIEDIRKETPFAGVSLLYESIRS